MKATAIFSADLTSQGIEIGSQNARQCRYGIGRVGIHSLNDLLLIPGGS